MIKNKVTFHFKYPIHYQKRVGWGEGFPSSDGGRRDGGGGGGGRWGQGGGKARRRRWGAGGCSMGVKRSPEVGDGGGDQ